MEYAVHISFSQLLWRPFVSVERAIRLMHSLCFRFFFFFVFLRRSFSHPYSPAHARDSPGIAQRVQSGREATQSWFRLKKPIRKSILHRVGDVFPPFKSRLRNWFHS
jgi:hypothetical protein